MNILMLHSSSGLYGSGKILSQIAENLRKNGHNVTVVLSEDGPLGETLRAHGIEVVKIRLGIIRRKYFNFSGILNRIKISLKAYIELKRLAKIKNTDLIYSNTTAVVVGAFVANSLKLRHVWHVHEIIIKPIVIYRFIGWLLKSYGGEIIAVSEAVKSHWSPFLQPNNIKLVYNGIDISPFEYNNSQLKTELGLSEETIVIGMIGRIHFWKGQKYFLQIASELLKKKFNIHFVMVGDAFPGYEYLYEELKNTKNDLQIGHAISDIGYREDIPNILSGIDILVLPSTLPDPFPTVILEAMAASKPVIATHQGGAPEMIENGISGLLIPLHDAKKSAELISPILSNKTLMLKMGKMGNKRLKEKFSLSAFNLAVNQIIDS